MLNDLSENVNKEIENIKMELEGIKKNQLEMKNPLEWINSRSDDAEDGISDLKDKVAENTRSKQQKGKRIQKNEDNIKLTNICILGYQKKIESKEPNNYILFKK